MIIILLNNFWSSTIEHCEGFPGAARDPSGCCRKSHRGWSPLSEFYFKFNINFEYPLYYFCSVSFFYSFQPEFIFHFQVVLVFLFAGNFKKSIKQPNSVQFIDWLDCLKPLVFNQLIDEFVSSVLSLLGQWGKEIVFHCNCNVGPVFM